MEDHVTQSMAIAHVWMNGKGRFVTYVSYRSFKACVAVVGRTESNLLGDMCDALHVKRTLKAV